MKLSARIIVRLVAAVVLCMALAGTASAVPPLCEDICTMSSPCSQILLGPGPQRHGRGHHLPEVGPYV